MSRLARGKQGDYHASACDISTTIDAIYAKLSSPFSSLHPKELLHSLLEAAITLNRLDHGFPNLHTLLYVNWLMVPEVVEERWFGCDGEQPVFFKHSFESPSLNVSEGCGAVIDFHQGTERGVLGGLWKVAVPLSEVILQHLLYAFHTLGIYFYAVALMHDRYYTISIFVQALQPEEVVKDVHALAFHP